MRSPPTHDFRLQRDFHCPQKASSFVAIVDLDSFPPFPAGKSDRLDLLQHMCAQLDALTATMWEVPASTLQLQVIWTDNDSTLERLKQAGHRGVADGYVRTDGHLCLMGDNQLFEGKRPRHNPRHPPPTRSEDQPHVLLVLPGVYSVGIFNGLASGPYDQAALGYTVLLHHHPHPPPRLHPVRLNGLMPFGMAPGMLKQGTSPSDSYDSHKMPR